MTAGLLISGALVPVDGLTILPPASHGGPAWARLDPGDYRMRPTTWLRQVIVHSTGGRWPMPIIDGCGPGGECERYADIWQSDPTHSAAHLVVDSAGTVACLADLARIESYHAEGSNPWSVGIEMAQGRDGSVHRATIEATADLVVALCKLLGIPEQMPDRYHGEPLMRMEFGSGAQRRNLGGPDCAGVFGHRNNSGERGRGDPGDAIFEALARRAFEAFDFDGRQDIAVGQARQLRLNELDALAGNTWRPLVLDGVAGPASIAAMRRHGIKRWSDVTA